LLPLEESLRKQIRDKRERHRLQCERALVLFDTWWQQQEHFTSTLRG
jgi:methylenetetrahydrofolate--tRNA-(uracil-5-)-methyltransferase